MQVLCKSSSEQAETCCSVCGQGFALYWERQTKTERVQALREIDKTLRSHHYNQAGPEAHPNRGFLVPEWKGQVAFSGAAILGNAPSWAPMKHLTRQGLYIFPFATDAMASLASGKRKERDGRKYGPRNRFESMGSLGTTPLPKKKLKTVP